MEASRRALGENAGIICVMSGNFVQRGDFAVYDKWARAETAVWSGADLAVELPLPYVLSSAEHFAWGAVSLLDMMGVVTHLSFGSESGNIGDLSPIAEILVNDKESIGAIMKTGKSYPAACEEAVRKTLGDYYGKIIKSPNNILGIEYIKSLKRLSSKIEPMTIERKGSGHDSRIGGECFASAAYIRNQIKTGGDIGEYVPDSALDVLKDENEAGRGPVYMDNAEQALLALLRFMDKADFGEISDLSEGIENRLMKAVKSEASLLGIINKTKTKRYPESRVRRMLLNACLGIREGDRSGYPQYIRVLALNDRGRTIIREISSKCSIPLITKPAKIKKTSAEARRMFALEARATDLYVLACTEEKNRVAGREWRQGPWLL